jgi:large subunit ribosomal protein L19e
LSLKNQRRLAAEILNLGESRVWIASDRIEDVSTAITRADIRRLINEGAIKAVPKKGISRGRQRVLHAKKKRGLRRAHGSRKGTAGARAPKKQLWTGRIRLIREHLRDLRDRRVIAKNVYRNLYGMAKGGAFKSVSHLEQYLQVHKLVKRR